MIDVQLNAETSGSPVLDTAWTTPETANDLRDVATVETCRRVIDATLCGNIPVQSDIDVAFDHFKQAPTSAGCVRA
jgi:hypothetical protein